MMYSNSFWNKKNVVVFLSFSSIIVTFSFDSIVAVSSIIGSSYEDGSYFGNALISGVYGVGLGFGSLFLGPLFDSRGRREIFILGMFIVFISSILSCLVVTINQLLITRFLQGLGVASQILASRCILSDYFDDENELSSAYSVVFVVSFISAVLAPLVSSFLVSNEFFAIGGSNWKILFIQMALISFTIFSILLFFPETANIEDKNNGKGYFSYMKDYFDNFKNKEFVMYSLVSSLFAAFLYTYFLSISFVMQDLIKIDLSTYTIMLSVNMIFGAFGSYFNSKLLEKFSLSFMISLGCNILIVAAVIFMFVAIDFDVVVDIGNYTKAYIANLSFLFIIFAYGVACPNLMVKIISAVDPKFKGNAISALGIMQIAIGMAICNIIGYFATVYVNAMAISIGLLILSIITVIVDFYCKKLFEQKI